MIRTAAALVLSLAIPHALAAGGAFDPAVGTQGVASVIETTNDLNLVFARTPEGKFIVVRNGAESVIVMRRNADGTPDTTFGAGGQVVHGRAVPIPSQVPIVPLAVKRILFQGARMLLAGEATAACGTPGIARLNANGTVDTTFGLRGWSVPVAPSRGVARCSFGSGLRIPELRTLPDGRIMLVAQSFRASGGAAVEGDQAIVRWSANGELEASYGGRGFVEGFPWSGEPGGVRIFDEGHVVMVRSEPEGNGRWRVLATTIDAAGAMRADTQLPAPEEFRGAPVMGVVDGGGRLYIHPRELPGGTLAVAQFVRNALLGSYGAGGVARVALGHPSAVRASFATPDGGTLYLADSQDAVTDGRNDAIVALKLDATGIPEPSFEVAGRRDISTSALSEFPHQALLDVDGYLSLFAYTTFRSGGDVRYGHYYVRLQAVPDIVEFEHPGLGHYFITYDGAEARGIDAGAAGAGWIRTGASFRPGGASAVCRFYGTPGIGPNSHFYTADADECALVKQARGWSYEGIAFHVATPTDGLCRAGQRPLYRLYNDRAAQNDSNHRYLLDESLIASMVERGWILEGLVFCPPIDPRRVK